MLNVPASPAIERRRARYRPPEISLLFVGDSAPAGGTFFYTENATLHHDTRAAFARTLAPQIVAARPSLDVFKELGCYLNDLCLEPTLGPQRGARSGVTPKTHSPNVFGRTAR